MSSRLQIETLTARIAERLAALGLSERQASLLATGRPDALRYIRTRKAMPSAERIFKLAQVLQADPSYLTGHADENNWGEISGAVTIAAHLNADAIEQLRDVPEGEKTAPCFSARDGGILLFPDVNGRQMHEIDVTYVSKTISHVLYVPPNLTSKIFMGFQITNNNLEPIHKNGEYVLVDYEKKPDIGDIVFLDVAAASDGLGRIFIGAQLIGRTRTLYTLFQVGNGIEYQVPIEQVSEIGRAVSYAELVSLP